MIDLLQMNQSGKIPSSNQHSEYDVSPLLGQPVFSRTQHTPIIQDDSEIFNVEDHSNNISLVVARKFDQIRNICSIKALCLGTFLFCLCAGLIYEHIQVQQMKSRVEDLNQKHIESYLKGFAMNEHEERDQPGKVLPKILWIYTQFDLNGEKMLEKVMAHYAMHQGKSSGWEIKIVNSWTANKFLTEETFHKVTYARHHLFIHEKIDDLLRYALLMDNGGVMIRVDSALPIQTFTWLEQHFPVGTDSGGAGDFQVLFFERPDYSTERSEYHDFMLAAVPRAKLITHTFNGICQITTTGDLTLPRLKQAKVLDEQTNSTSIQNLAQNIFRSCLQIMTPIYFKALVLNLYPSNKINLECRNRAVAALTKSKTQYHKICGFPRHFIYLPSKFHRTQLEDALQKLIDQQQLETEKESYWRELMVVPYNQQLYEPVEPRKIHYCLLDAHPSSNFQALRESFEHFKKQSHKQWTAVYFYEKGEPARYQEYIKEQGALNFSIVIGEGSSSMGRNYELGIIKHCPNKSFIVVLKRDERLSSLQSLQDLVATIQARDVLGAYVKLNISGKVTENREEYQNYTKIDYSALNPRYDDLTSILNHLRVFHSDCYKIIPQFDLRTPEGQYFNNRFNFLEIFIYMTIRSEVCSDGHPYQHTNRIKWLVKQSRHLFDVPFRINFHTKVLIDTPTQDQIDKEEIYHNRFKENAYTMLESMDHLISNGQPMEEFAIFNPGKEFVPYTKRNKPQRVPKIIHQVWVGNKIAESKLVLIKLIREMYPDFQYKLWGNENITRQNFPFSYDLIMSTFQCDKTSRFSKMAVAADIMRHEILYREGGIWLDTQMYPFRRIFDQWLNYRLVISTLQTFRHRFIQGMGFWAVEPGYYGLQRIVSVANINRYDLYRREALRIAGNYDFRQLIKGYEEYDDDTLIMGYDAFYPTDYGLNDISGARCALPLNQIPAQDEIILKYDRWGSNFGIIKNCEKYYPYAYARQSGAVGGGTWFVPKW